MQYETERVGMRIWHAAQKLCLEPQCALTRSGSWYQPKTNVKLILQPDDGVAPLIKAIDSAKKKIEIAIFRFDRTDIKRALERAVARGVSVHALIANTNRGEEKELRKLEMDFLPAGIEVSRTRGRSIALSLQIHDCGWPDPLCADLQLHAPGYRQHSQLWAHHAKSGNSSRRLKNSLKRTLNARLTHLD